MEKIDTPKIPARDCRNCYFHETTTKADQSLVTICRKRFEIAHVAIPVNGQAAFVGATLWAEMRPGDWCGDFDDMTDVERRTSPSALFAPGPR